MEAIPPHLNYTEPMARITLSAEDLSRLIDGLEGTTHQDIGPIDQNRTDRLISRLVNLYDRAMQG